MTQSVMQVKENKEEISFDESLYQEFLQAQDKGFVGIFNEYAYVRDYT